MSDLEVMRAHALIDQVAAECRDLADEVGIDLRAPDLFAFIRLFNQQLLDLHRQYHDDDRFVNRMQCQLAAWIRAVKNANGL